jgi:hypothetical protein
MFHVSTQICVLRHYLKSPKNIFKGDTFPLQAEQDLSNSRQAEKTASEEVAQARSLERNRRGDEVL